MTEFKPGIYRHYKGNLYNALFVARNTETDEELVIYQPLYVHPSGGLPMQARPLKMFFELVRVDVGECKNELRDWPYEGKSRAPRFQYLGQSIPAADKKANPSS